MDVFDLQAKISLDVSGYINAIKQAQEQTEKLKIVLSGIKNPLSDGGRSLMQLTENLKNAQDATKNASQEVDRLKEELERSKRETGENSEETRQLTERLKDAEKELERCKDAEHDLTNELEDYARRTDDADHETDDLEDSIRRTGETSEESGRQISGFGDLLLANLASTAITKGIDLIIDGIKQIGQATFGFIKQSVQVGMTFDSAMSQVAATSGKSMDQLLEETATVDLAWGTFSGNLREYAKEIGKNTAYSATQAAEALNYMALAGYDTEKSMRMLPQVMNLASAGAMDLANASDMITDTQTALGMSIERTGQMVNEMATAAASSNTSVEQLGSAILTIGGTAKSLQGGMTTLSDGTTKAYDGVTELNAALGILADNGTKGAEGGTALRNVLSTMKGDKFEKSFGALGVSVYDVDGKMRALKDIFADMSKAMEGYTDQQRDEIIMNTFNARSLKDINALLDTSSERWDQLTAKMVEAADAGDAAQKMANTQLNNLGGSITLFNSALEAAQIAISDSLSPELTKFVKMGTDQISDLTAVFEEKGLSGVIDKLPDIFNQWVDAVTDFVSNIAGQLDISKVLTSIAKALTTITSQIPGIIKNVIPQLLAGAIEAADIIVNGFFDTINELFTPQSMTGFFTSLLDIIGKLGDFIGSNVGGLIDAAVAIIDALTESFYSPEVVSKIFETAASLVRSLVDGLTGGNHLQKLLDAALNITLMMQKVFMEPKVIESVTEAAAIIVSELAKGILQALPQIANSLAGFAKNVVDFIINYDWSAAADGFVGGFMSGFDSMDWSFLDDVSQKWVDFWDGVVKYWEPAYNKISEIVRNVGNSISNFFGNISSKISEFLQPAVDSVTGIWNGFMDIFSPLLESFRYLFETIFTGVQVLVGRAFNKIKDDATEKWNEITDFMNPVLEQIQTNISSTWENVSNIFTTVLDKIKGFVTNAWESITSSVDTTLAPVKDAISNIWDNIVTSATNWGKDMLDNFISGIKSRVAAVSSAVTNVADTIRRIIGFSEPKEGPLSNFHTYAPDMMNLFADGIRANAGKVESEITSLAESMRPDLDYTATVSAGYGSVSPYSAYTGTTGAGASPSLETIVTLLNGILVATQQGHYVSVTDIDTSLGRRQAAEIRRGI